MQIACIPIDEAERLVTLRNLDLLDTAPSASFDRVTRLAADLLDAPMVLVSLVDEDRQWFKSKLGLSAAQTSREVSFCAHAVFNREALIVDDATQDPRFASNPLVTGAPHIRAYLGIPIFSTQGHAVGTLCAIDTRARTFDEHCVRKLTDCSQIVEQLIHAQELAKSTSDVLRFATEREKLFRDTFEQAAVGITHTSFTGKLLRVNQRTCDMLGYSAAEIQQISFLEITHPEDVAANLAYLRKMIAGELESYRMEKRFLRKDGSYLWTEISIALKRSESGEPDYMIAVIEDIASRKLAEFELMQVRDSLRSQVQEQTAQLRESNEALRIQIERVVESERELREADALGQKIEELERSEQRFQCLVRLTSQVIWTNSAQGRMEGEQPGWSAFTGQSFDEYQGFGWSTAVHPEDAQPTIDEWNRSVAECRPFLFEHRVRRHDGVYRVCTIDATPVLNANGSIREWVGVHNDITERRQHEKEIRAQEAKFRFLAESLPQMVWTARPDGSADYYNGNWFSYTGMTQRQAEAGDWGPVHPDDIQRSIRVWNHSVKTGEPYQVEHRFKRASDATYRWHLCRALRLRDEQGGTVKWFGTCTDIQDYKEADAKNRQLQAELEGRVHQRTAELETANRDLKEFSEKLERSNRELQDFASVASHDLQEPLRKVQTFGDRLKTICGATMDEQGLDYLDRMLSATSRMHSLIQDLLSFSRVNSRPRAFVPVDLAQVAREVLADLEICILETGAHVNVADLPIVDADPMLMRQLLQNLIGNAIKFRKTGCAPEVRIRSHAVDPRPDGDGFCTILVEDDGIGFDEKYLDRIFKVFQRLHGRNEYEGTGVGLAICRKIAWRHGGEITARSSPGRGSVFTVALPMRQVNLPAEQTLEHRSSVPGGGQSVGSRTAMG